MLAIARRGPPDKLDRQQHKHDDEEDAAHGCNSSRAFLQLVVHKDNPKQSQELWRAVDQTAPTAALHAHIAAWPSPNDQVLCRLTSPCGLRAPPPFGPAHIPARERCEAVWSEKAHPFSV